MLQALHGKPVVGDAETPVRPHIFCVFASFFVFPSQRHPLPFRVPLHLSPCPSSHPQHSVTLQTHLLGYEFPDTVLLLVRDAGGTRLIVHATAKKRA